MRTALAASVAAVAKWTFVAAPLGLQAVPKRRSVWSIAAGTRFARPVPQPESRHIDLPEQGQVYVESLLIMRTALAASVAAAAKWIFGAASLGLQAVPERLSVWSRAAGTRFARPVPQPENRRIDLLEQVKSLLIMRTALAVRVAAAAKWILWRFLWGCRLFRNGSLCGQGQPEQALPVLFRNQKAAILICRNGGKSMLKAS